MQITKRDGRIEEFQAAKVIKALSKAFRSCDKNLPEDLEQAVVEHVTKKAQKCERDGKEFRTEDVDNIIEKVLQQGKQHSAFKVYAKKRRDRNRKRTEAARNVFRDIIDIKNTDVTRENANMNADTPAGMMMKFASESTKSFVDEELLDDDVRAFVKDNKLHIHDKDYYPTRSFTCLAKDTKITINDKEGSRYTNMGYFDKYFKDQTITTSPTMGEIKEDVYIVGRDKVTKVLNVSRRYVGDDENLYSISTSKGVVLKATPNHQIPIIAKTTKDEVLKSVEDIQVGDGLLYNGLGEDLPSTKDVEIIIAKDVIDKEGVVVYDIETEEHWFTANGYIVHNCVQHPLDHILNEGFQAGHGSSRPAKRIETASVLACISMETAQNEMHGGQAIPAFDFYLAPFVRMSFIEEVKKLEAYDGGNYEHLYNVKISDYIKKDLKGLSGDEKIVQAAINNTVGRVHQAMEAFIHNMNTIHSRGGNQVVFSSINFGTDTSAEGRCVIREILLSTYEGVGNGETAIFPIQIWKSKSGVSYLPGDPNYDLYELACKVTARRFFPNFLNLDATYNQDADWKADDPKRYEHEVATMGCVDGKEVISYKKDNVLYVTSIERMWKHLAKSFEIESQTQEGYDDGEYIDLKGIEIQDGDKFVKCYRIIKNPDKGDWYKVTLTNGRVLTCTSDHPWSIINNGQEETIITKNLMDGDIVSLNDIQPINETTENSHSESLAWLYGFIMCDGCYDGQLMSTVGMDEQDIADKYIQVFKDELGFNVCEREQHRGQKGNYIELKVHCPKNSAELNFRNTLSFSENFAGVKKINRHIPGWVFNSSYDVRCSFLAGMIDADGYFSTNRDRVKVHLGSTNKEMAIQTCLLAQSLGIPAKMYDNHYAPGKIRVRVEFDAFPELIRFMASQKKRDKFKEIYGEPIRFNSGIVSKIEYLGEREECSYDVTTESEYFTVSGIRSHNCRTRVFENRFGPKTSIGRGNISFSTINIVRLAIECMGIEDENERIEAFFEKLDETLDITAKQLDDRFNFQKQALAKQFPLLMTKLWIGCEDLKATDRVESVINQGTLGIGFIGLAECLVALRGKHHGEDEKSQELGLCIVTHMRDRVNGFCEQYKHNYSVLATPAEGLSGKFTKVDQKEFGKIPGVTDRDYYTNSNHVPVYYKCSAKHKAEVEAPYHELTRGGHIFYVEIDGDATHNPDVVKGVVDMMHAYNMGYGSINHNRNRCMDCGYEDASEGLKVCPKCGSKNIDVLQRITGYLVGTTERWNHGKLSELKDRVTHIDTDK